MPPRGTPMRFDAPDSLRGSAAVALPPHFALGDPVARGVPPFDAAALDRLLEAAGLDLVLVTSRQSIQYLLGGYSFYFFDVKEALGLSRYLPVLVYVRGRPDLAAYIGSRLESHETQLGRIWAPVVEATSWTTTEAIGSAVAHIARIGVPAGRIGVEPAFLPLDAADALRTALPGCELVDARYPLERLRAVKTAGELALLQHASESVVDAMLAVIDACEPGMTKKELADRLQLEEVRRGLSFEYCLVTAGSGLNRSPSAQRLAAGDIISLDSGGNYRGYIGDLCRMGILGAPDAELEDLLGVVREIQEVSRRQVRAGGRGGDVFTAGRDAAAASPHAAYLDFLAHGMGLVAHEAPWLTAEGFVPYPGYDADRPLDEGMVLSIETALLHPSRGFIKLEDTVVVTADGHVGLGDAGRGWNRAAA